MILTTDVFCTGILCCDCCLRFVYPGAGTAGAGLSKTMFATSNQINSTTLDVVVVTDSVNLWSGSWNPSPLAPPMSGKIPSIASGACYRSGCHGFTAELDSSDPAPRVNGSFVLEAAEGSGMTGYVAIAFAQVGQEFIVERSEGGNAGVGSLDSDMWGVEVGDTMVYTLVLRAKAAASYNVDVLPRHPRLKTDETDPALAAPLSWRDVELSAVERTDALSTERFINASCNNATCSAFDVGVSIGKLQKETIAKMFEVRMDFYRRSDHNGKLAAWPKYANMSLSTLEKYAPTTLEEMKGVAVGAGLPLTTLLQLATDYENSLWLKGVSGQQVNETTMPTKACTAFGFTDSASGRAFCGQNNDEKHTEFLNGTLDAIVARPAIASVHGPAVATITYSHPGMPAYMGTNGAGLSVLWTAIAFKDTPVRPTETVPTVVLLREVLQFTTLDGAVAYLRDTPRSVPNNFILVSSPPSGWIAGNVAKMLAMNVASLSLVLAWSASK